MTLKRFVIPTEGRDLIETELLPDDPFIDGTLPPLLKLT